MKNKPTLFLICCTLFSLCACQQQTASTSDTTTMTDNQPLLLFVGTYTRTEGHVDGKASGIYLYEMDKETGALSFVSSSPATVNPSYLTIHPNGQWVYAVNEIAPDATVSAFKLDRTSKTPQLTFLNSVSAQGTYPCYISTDKEGRYAMVANYGSGTVALYPIGENGALEEATSVIQHSGSEPHAHMIVPTPDNKFIYANDLGIDQVLIYELDTTNNQLVATHRNATTQAGAGPRHLAFHPQEAWVYVLGELNGTIEAFHRDAATGTLHPIQTISTMVEGDTSRAHSADIHITPSGEFLYATNRGEVNNIAMYRVDAKTGQLALLGHQSTQGKTPRNFVIDPSGNFLLVANQDSGNVVTFRINANTGLLQETGINTEIPTPVCLKFLH